MRTLAALVLAATVAVTACGDGGDEAPAAEGGASTATSREPAPAAAEPMCADGALGERRYVLCTAGDQVDQSLVVALHGRGSSAAAMQAGTGLHELAAAEGLAVVYPESLDGRWGDDTFTSPARPAGDEDVVFLDALIHELRADHRIVDDGDVGVVGFRMVPAWPCAMPSRGPTTRGPSWPWPANWLATRRSGPPHGCLSSWCTGRPTRCGRTPPASPSPRRGARRPHAHASDDGVDCSVRDRRGRDR